MIESSGTSTGYKPRRRPQGPIADHPINIYTTPEHHARVLSNPPVSRNMYRYPPNTNAGTSGVSGDNRFQPNYQQYHQPSNVRQFDLNELPSGENDQGQPEHSVFGQIGSSSLSNASHTNENRVTKNFLKHFPNKK